MANLILLHFDEADESTTITDSGSGGYTLSLDNGAANDTAEAKFGTASFRTSGSTHRLYASDFDSWPAGAWTFECFAKLNSFSGGPNLLAGVKSVGGQGVYLSWDATTSKLKLYLSSDGSTVGDIANGTLGTTTSWSTSQWYHIAVCYDGSGYYVYLDGTAEISVVDSTPVSYTGGHLIVGNNAFTNNDLGGWIDELRITDTAVYPSGTPFTPPSTPFADPTPAARALTYIFDAGSGATVIDQSGNDHDGIITGASYGSGVLAFDGSGDYVQYTEDNLDLDLLGSVTVEVRFKLDASASGWKPLFTKNDLGATGTRTLELWVNASNGHIDVYSDDGTGNQFFNHTSASISVDTWHNIAASLDRSGGTITLYLDGSSISLVSSSLRTEDAYDSSGAYIGYFYGGSFAFHGEMQSFQLWNEARSVAQITTDFTAMTSGATGTISTDLPLKTIEAETGGADNTLPMLTLSAGDNSVIQALPIKTISAASAVGTYLNEVLPIKDILAGGGVGGLTENDSTVEVSLPLFSIDSVSDTGVAGSLSAILPLKTIAAGGNHSAFLSIPLLTIGGVLKTGNTAMAALRKPAITSSAEVITSGFASASNRLPRKSLSTNLDTGTVITASLAMPMRRLTSYGVRYNNAAMVVLLPELTITSTGGPNITATAAIDLPSMIVEAIAFNVPSSVFRAWVSNMRTGVLSEYNNFGFNSFTEFDGVVLGANGNGLYSLGTQGTDDGTEIDSVFRTGISGFDTSYLKRIPRLYLGYRSDGNMIFRTITTHDGPRSYRVPANGNTSHHQRRVPIGRGPKSTYWQFEVANENGSDFSINSMLFYPQVLKRRNL